MAMGFRLRGFHVIVHCFVLLMVLFYIENILGEIAFIFIFLFFTVDKKSGMTIFFVFIVS